MSLHGIVGAMYVGVLVADALYGISVIQAFYYYRHQNDRWFIKSLVTAVMVCDTIHQALIAHTVYAYAISSWGEVDELGKISGTLIIANLPNGITTLLVQTFLTARVWRLSDGNILLTGLIGSIVLAGFVSVTVFTFLGLPFQNFVELVTLKPLSLAVNILSVVGDALIAMALCVLLHRSRTGFQRSDTMINKLILFTVNAGVLTGLCALASFISYLVSPNTFIYVAFYWCIGRLYTNSLLATLNARKMIRSGSSGVHNNITDKVSLPLRDLPKNSSAHGPGNISIKFNTTTVYQTDIEQHRGCDTDKVEYLDTPDTDATANEG